MNDEFSLLELCMIQDIVLWVEKKEFGKEDKYATKLGMRLLKKKIERIIQRTEEREAERALND